MALWVIRILFLGLCVIGGYAISQVRPEFVGGTYGALFGMLFGFGFGGLMIALDEMLKGFSLRAFSATTFGLLLGMVVAVLIDRSGLFDKVDEDTRMLVRIGLFLAFSYIGIVLAMRSNKEDFSLIIPYVRFAPRNKPDNLLLLDTSAIIDGRIADLIEANFLEGIIVVPRFVLKELQQVADSTDPIKRARGRRGLEMLNRIQRNQRNEVKIHEGDFPEEREVDAKLSRLARNLGAKLFTNDHNLSKIAELQSVNCVNLHDLAKSLRSILLPGELLSMRIVREGKDKGQGIGYLPDGTMVVVNNGQSHVGQQVLVQVQSSLQTGAGVIVFADVRPPAAA
ncbi:MAG: twitching motility protein PilT [Verrucomicrobiae bacterium]|nr:twitching motility protein PilT [Verrucomicrobiae bacterium]